MASIMFLGYSNLIKGRILPILSKAGFTEVTIAKYAGQLVEGSIAEGKILKLKKGEYIVNK